MHDPLQCVRQLRQVLAADKLAVGFFLGAGCPCAIRVPNTKADGDAPLVPAIAGLTKIVSASLLDNATLSKHFATLRQTFTRDNNVDPSVEDMLSRIRILREAAGTESARGLSAQDLDALDEEICRAISAIADKSLPNSSTPYHALGRMAVGTEILRYKSSPQTMTYSRSKALESLHCTRFRWLCRIFSPILRPTSNRGRGAPCALGARMEAPRLDKLEI